MILVFKVSFNNYIVWKKESILADHTDDTGFLADWIMDSDNHYQGCFNFSSYWFTILDQLINNVSKPFLLLAYDFSAIRPSKPNLYQETYGQFGVCIFYCIPFFLLKRYCQKRNIQFLSSQFTNSENQLAVITSVEDSVFLDSVQTILNQTEPGEVVSNMTAQLQSVTSVLDISMFLNKSKTALSQDQCCDYGYLFAIARKYYDLQDYDQSIYYLDQIIHDYKHTALMAAVLKIKCLRKKNDLDAAIQLAKQWCQIEKNFDLLWLEQLYIYADLNDSVQFNDALNAYFNCVTNNPQWQLAQFLK